MDLGWQLQGVILFVALLTLLMLGMPVSFSLGVVSLFGILFFLGPNLLPVLAHTTWGAVSVFVFAAVPLFFLMSEVITFTGISSDVFDATYKWLNWVPGALAIVSVVTCAIFGAISGTGVGVAAMVGTASIPQMLKYGYEKKLATGSVAAASALGMVIPPSLPLIIYGAITEQSVGKLFIGGIIPGLAVTALFSIYIALRVVVNPDMAPKHIVNTTWKDRIVSFKKVWPIATLIILIIGGIYAGVYTPTEAAAAGAAGAIIIAAVYRKLTWRKLWDSLIASTRITSMVIFIVVGAMLFGYLLTSLGVARNLSTWIVDLGISRWLVFIMIHLVWLILGCFIEVSSIILITIPVFYPIAIALGFDPIWFGIVMMINMCAAVVTPPMGLCAFVVHSVAPEVPLSDVFKGIIPFIIIVFAAIVLFCVFPDIVMVLPNMMFAK
ncbi:MAG: TRAP transporter large permease [Dehalococcoidales bacterium]|nr:TRAP transporter large permease [Dehalococcoidales bacterium]